MCRVRPPHSPVRPELLEFMSEGMERLRLLLMRVAAGALLVTSLVFAIFFALDGEAYFAQGQASYAAGDYQNAIRNYNRAAYSMDLTDKRLIELFITRGEAYIGRAEQMCRAGRINKAYRQYGNAARSFNEALKHDPDNARAKRGHYVLALFVCD